MYSNLERDRECIQNSVQLEDDEPLWFIRVMTESLSWVTLIVGSTFRIHMLHTVSNQTHTEEN